MPSITRLAFLLIASVFFLAACSAGSSTPAALTANATATANTSFVSGPGNTPEIAQPDSSTSTTLSDAAPPTQPASPTPTPTAAPTATQTAAPTPTPTPHPMSIPAQRQGSYPGSPIAIVEELERGANYNRYYAYYLSEGLKIYSLLTVPDGEPPAGGWPAIVFNHGYIPPDVYRTTERYIAYVDNLARSGYIVFRIDYRGHDRSEGEARGAYGNPGYQTDVLNAVASIKQFPQANPERIGMWGHSMGGYLTLRSMVISSDIKAGVIWAGVVGSYDDMLNRWRRGPPLALATPQPARSWRYSWVEQYGTPADNPEFWNSLSANSYLADISGPVQLHHGNVDEEVPWEFSQTLYDQLTAAGKEVEFYIYRDDNHNLSNQFTTAMTRSIEFFDRYLKTD